MAKEEQQRLFDEQDLILNTLSTEHSEILAEVERTESSIKRNEEKLVDLEERSANLLKSMNAAKKLGGSKKKKRKEGCPDSKDG